MNEIEATYLAKYLPKNLALCKSILIEDSYFPLQHPRLRLRRKGDEYNLIRKSMIMQGDASQHKEEKITLNKHHYDALKEIEGEGLQKRRYFFPYNNYVAEIDVFLGVLEGLVLVEFEFKDKIILDNFDMPEFCLIDVTQDRLIAGGNLAGKSYQDIEKNLKKYNYNKLLKP